MRRKDARNRSRRNQSLRQLRDASPSVRSVINFFSARHGGDDIARHPLNKAVPAGLFCTLSLTSLHVLTPPAGGSAPLLRVVPARVCAGRWTTVRLPLTLLALSARCGLIQTCLSYLSAKRMYPVDQCIFQTKEHIPLFLCNQPMRFLPGRRLPSFECCNCDAPARN